MMMMLIYKGVHIKMLIHTVINTYLIRYTYTVQQKTYVNTCIIKDVQNHTLTHTPKITKNMVSNEKVNPSQSKLSKLYNDAVSFHVGEET